jgi:hypothetical protein
VPSGAWAECQAPQGRSPQRQHRRSDTEGTRCRLRPRSQPSRRLPGVAALRPPRRPHPRFQPTHTRSGLPSTCGDRLRREGQGEASPQPTRSVQPAARTTSCSESQTCGCEAGTHHCRPANDVQLCGAKHPSATTRLAPSQRHVRRVGTVHADQFRRAQCPQGWNEEDALTLISDRVM